MVDDGPDAVRHFLAVLHRSPRGSGQRGVMPAQLRRATKLVERGLHQKIETAPVALGVRATDTQAAELCGLGREHVHRFLAWRQITFGPSYAVATLTRLSVHQSGEDDLGLI